MTEAHVTFSSNIDNKNRLQDVPRLILAPMPLFPIQPLLKRIVNYVSDHRPELFARLGTHKNTTYIIDPTNMPFILRLFPNPKHPTLSAHRRSEDLIYDARISGSFLTLLSMIDGRLDGDSLFFTRDLKIEGNTEAVVCLRNAIDDLEGSIMDDVTQACGVFSKPLQHGLSLLRRQDHIQ